MSVFGSLSDAQDESLLYDGSLAGFYTAAGWAFSRRTMPGAVSPYDEAYPALFGEIYIKTDSEAAESLRRAIAARLSPRALELTETVFLSCLPKKEIALLRFLELGGSMGRKTPHLLTHEAVAPLIAAERHLGREAHLLRGFTRFEVYEDRLIGVISPKNFVLPYLAKHFISRYANESFILYDSAHKTALIYEKRKARLIPLPGLTPPEATDSERGYQDLWKAFYSAIAITARENLKTRMGHMPKRYWHNMTEMRDLL